MVGNEPLLPEDDQLPLPLPLEEDNINLPLVLAAEPLPPLLSNETESILPNEQRGTELTNVLVEFPTEIHRYLDALSETVTDVLTSQVQSPELLSTSVELSAPSPIVESEPSLLKGALGGNSGSTPEFRESVVPTVVLSQSSMARKTEEAGGKAAALKLANSDLDIASSTLSWEVESLPDDLAKNIVSAPILPSVRETTFHSIDISDHRPTSQSSSHKEDLSVSEDHVVIKDYPARGDVLHESPAVSPESPSSMSTAGVPPDTMWSRQGGKDEDEETLYEFNDDQFFQSKDHSLSLEDRLTEIEGALKLFGQQEDLKDAQSLWLYQAKKYVSIVGRELQVIFTYDLREEGSLGQSFQSVLIELKKTLSSSDANDWSQTDVEHVLKVMSEQTEIAIKNVPETIYTSKEDIESIKRASILIQECKQTLIVRQQREATPPPSIANGDKTHGKDDIAMTSRIPSSFVTSSLPAATQKGVPPDWQTLGVQLQGIVKKAPTSDFLPIMPFEWEGLAKEYLTVASKDILQQSLGNIEQRMPPDVRGQLASQLVDMHTEGGIDSLAPEEITTQLTHVHEFATIGSNYLTEKHVTGDLPTFLDRVKVTAGDLKACKPTQLNAGMLLTVQATRNVAAVPVLTAILPPTGKVTPIGVCADATDQAKAEVRHYSLEKNKVKATALIKKIVRLKTGAFWPGEKGVIANKAQELFPGSKLGDTPTLLSKSSVISSDWVTIGQRKDGAVLFLAPTGNNKIKMAVLPVDLVRDANRRFTINEEVKVGFTIGAVIKDNKNKNKVETGRGR
ncbi:MAG: hypothetical protein V4568_20120 [Pseudomonadota bacterium]